MPCGRLNLERLVASVRQVHGEGRLCILRTLHAGEQVGRPSVIKNVFHPFHVQKPRMLLISQASHTLHGLVIFCHFVDLNLGCARHIIQLPG